MAITARGKGGQLSLYRRVPGRYAPVEPRKFVWVALGTDSPSLAERKGGAVWAEMIEAWEARLAGDTTDAEQRFEAAKALARARGFRFLPVERAAQLPLEELRDRMAAVTMRKDGPDLIEAAAVLGGAKEPPLTVTKALEAYWDLAREKTLGMSPDQFRRWRNPRIKAVKNFVDVVGDKPIARITGDDMLDYRRWWLDRIEAGEVQPDSYNKDLVHLGDVLKTVNGLKRLGLVLPLTDLAIRKGENRTRLPFSDIWIRDRLLAPGALDGLNVEARNVVKLMINTGLRLGEASNLQPGHIHLDGAVPYVEVAPTDARRLKTANARREIPLVGCSLEAMRECPQGFPRYVDKPGLSATVNKFLRENGLMETPTHTVYGLRHSFEDRLC